MRLAALCLFALVLPAAPKPEFRAGAGRIKITPAGPIWMSGYASRNHPSTGVANDLWAKALAIEDSRARKVVLVSTDLIGLPRAVSESVAAQVEKKYGIDRASLVLNSAHTHTGPVIRHNLATMYSLTPEQSAAVNAYTQTLTANLVTVIGAALGDLQPAVLSFGQGKTGFAANRREMTPKGVQLGVNPSGPVDHSVPVLRVSAPNGQVRAVLFGYACHNTTLTEDFYEISGDYAGFAQSEVEKAFPGATALFYMLCGGDQDPQPRGELELAIQHGKSLAAEVTRVAQGPMTGIEGQVKAAFQLTELPLAVHTREQFEKEANDRDVYKVRRAREMLKAYDERRQPTKVAYPVQAVRFKKGFTLVALGGEVVVDYALWAKSAFPNEPLMVAGYSNDVMCYIPTTQILKEGGYEPVDSMIYYGMPGPFSEDLENHLKDTIVAVVKRVMN